MKNNLTRIALMFVVLGLMILGYYHESISFLSQHGNAKYERIKYSFNLKNITNREIRNMRVWLLMPDSMIDMGVSASGNIDMKAKIFKNENNNELFLTAESFEKNGVVPVSVEIKIASSGLNDEKENNIDKYLLPINSGVFSSEKLINVASLVKGDDDFQASQKILDWLASEDFKTMVSVKQSEFDRLQLYLALSRKLNVPARGLIGFDKSTGEIQTASKVKIWAEYHDGSSWKVVNLDELKQLEKSDDFLVFKIIDDTYLENIVSQSTQSQIVSKVSVDQDSNADQTNNVVLPDLLPHSDNGKLIDESSVVNLVKDIHPYALLFRGAGVVVDEGSVKLKFL